MSDRAPATGPARQQDTTWLEHARALRGRRMMASATILGLGGPSALVGAALCARALMGWRALGHIVHRVDALPEGAVLVVLGARVASDGSPMSWLQARLDKAVAAYASGRVSTIVVSGDDGRHRWDEVGAMARALGEAGVAGSAIAVDAGARTTLDSVRSVRAGLPAGVDDAAPLVFVSQRHHLERALYLASALGCPALGLCADDPDDADVGREALYESAGALFAIVDVAAARLERGRGDRARGDGDGAATA